MAQLSLRPVSLEETRVLRRDVLRPYMEVEELATHEPAGAVAFGAFADGDLVAVGLVGPDGEPGDWRVRGMATRPDARGQGAGSAILHALVAARDRSGRDPRVVQRPHAGAQPVSARGLRHRLG